MRVLRTIALLIFIQFAAKASNIAARDHCYAEPSKKIISGKVQDVLHSPFENQSFRKKNKVKGIEPASPEVRDPDVDKFFFPDYILSVPISFVYCEPLTSDLNARGPPCF